MTKGFTSIRNMYAAIIAVLANFTIVWAGYNPFVSAVDDFKKQINDIDSNEQLQKMLIKGFTQFKKDLKQAMAVKANEVCRKVQAFASDNNPPLFGQMKISLSKIIYSNAALAKSYAEAIYTAVNTLTPAERTEYEISAQDIIDLRAAIDAFTNAMTLPRDRIVIRKFATEQMPVLFAIADKTLKEKLDNLMNNFVDNKDFFEQYRNARIIVSIIRHTTIQGDVVDLSSGADLKSVKVTFTSTENTFEEITNVQGKFSKGELNPELNWNVKFELPNYEPIEFADIDLSRGEHLKLDVKLRKINP